MTNQVSDQMIEYLAGRDAFRASLVERFLGGLTERERALISDIAVMGYVRGSMHPPGEPQPKRTPVLAEVISACFSFPDLYPAVDAVQLHTTSSKTEFFFEVQQPDMTWVRASSKSESHSYIQNQMELKQGRNPEWKMRIGWSVTSKISGSLPQPSEEE